MRFESNEHNCRLIYWGFVTGCRSEWLHDAQLPSALNTPFKLILKFVVLIKPGLKLGRDFVSVTT